MKPMTLAAVFACAALSVFGAMPEGYVPLTFISSTGDQFVKTDYVPKAATRIDCTVEVAPRQSAEWPTVFGARVGLSHANDITFFSHTDSTRPNVPSYSQCGVQTAAKMAFPYGRKTHLVCGGRTATWEGEDGRKGSVEQTGEPRDCVTPLYLFAINDAGRAGGEGRAPAWSRTTMKLYGLRIFEGEKLVREFAPCRNSAGEAGLWEGVGGRFYASAGRERFYGSDECEIAFAAPAGALRFTVFTDGVLRFALALKGRELIAPSAMGFAFKDEADMANGFALMEKPTVEKGLVDEWTPVVKNKHAHIRLVYNQLTLKLREVGGARRRMDLTVRLYDDGAAFRYTLYGRNRPQERLIVRELTEYRVPADSFAWVGYNGGSKDGYHGSQESKFTKTPVAKMSATRGALSPLLVKAGDVGWLALTSAHLDNFPGFVTTYEDGAIKTRLVPTVNEGGDGVKARFESRFDTAWRVIFAGENPGTFIESEIIRSLNPPCAIADTSWIKPGMSSWDHWWSGEVKMTMPVIKEYIDFASREGWPYMLVDWQWYGPFNRPSADITKWAPQIDLPALIAYAKERNVRLWLWLYCADANQNDAYVEAFKLYRKWGIAGVKIDFMDRYDREVANWYRKMTKAAAENRLLINFHGAFAPDGLDRTYPNQVTREGVMGAEYSKFSRGITGHHNVNLCFTRLLAGAMDYTPGAFLNVGLKDWRRGSPTVIANTRAAELAKFVVYESPVAFFCDHPRFVRGQAGEDFVAKVPTTWDDIRFLGGAPDEWVAIAKRSGATWYVGVMNADTAREVELDLSALGIREIQCWADSTKPANPAKPTCGKQQIHNGRLRVWLAPSGGFAGIGRQVEK